MQRQHLEGDVPAKGQLLRLVYHSHATAARPADDTELAQALTEQVAHGQKPPSNKRRPPPARAEMLTWFARWLRPGPEEEAPRRQRPPPGP
jgi:hypothetical protein